VELQEIEWNLSVVSRLNGIDDDLYIWDYESDSTLAGEEWIPDHKKIFVVSRRILASLQERLLGRPSRVFLKPANPFLLKAIVGDILAASRKPVSVESDRRCAAAEGDRDELFQSVLELNLRIQEYDQARSRFSVNGIHNLRVPLIAIMGYVKLLVDRQFGPLSPGLERARASVSSFRPRAGRKRDWKD
jgi:signal transduction histidine kinase